MLLELCCPGGPCPGGPCLGGSCPGEPCPGAQAVGPSAVPGASSAVVAEPPGRARGCLALAEQVSGQEPLEHPRAHKPAWKQPRHCCVPVTWLVFNRVAFGSFNFYLNICFPAEPLGRTALAPRPALSPWKWGCLLEALPTRSGAGGCLRAAPRALPAADPLAAPNRGAAGQLRRAGTGGPSGTCVLLPQQGRCARVRHRTLLLLAALSCTERQNKMKSLLFCKVLFY